MVNRINTVLLKVSSKRNITLCLILVHVFNGILLLSAISIIIYPDASYSPWLRDVNCGTCAVEVRGFRSRIFR